jgi:hypothetical protein
VKKWEAGRTNYKVSKKGKEALAKVRPKLTVHFVAAGKDSVKTRPASKAAASVGKPVEKPEEKPVEKLEKKPDAPTEN